ncbi:MAG: hypothetical protein H5U04_04435 [Firmicutes bacterium]|nr:hypothetical protein [Bacillota bacterium]
MKLTRVVLGLLLAVCLVGAAAGGYLWGSRASAQAPEPGTEQDPLVTKSYVDNRLQPLNLEVVELPKGKQLVAEAGAEIIMRSGKATVVPGNLGGLADVTAGKDLTKGDAPLNHLLVVPRSDGRGVKATTDCVVLVRGGYTIR